MLSAPKKNPARQANRTPVKALSRRQRFDAREDGARADPAVRARHRAHHLSVVPFSPEAIDAAREALAGFDLSNGTVRFAPDRPVPEAALDQLLRHRLLEIERG
jgi:hypothetical protein